MLIFTAYDCQERENANRLLGSGAPDTPTALFHFNEPCPMPTFALIKLMYYIHRTWNLHHGSLSPDQSPMPPHILVLEGNVIHRALRRSVRRRRLRDSGRCPAAWRRRPQRTVNFGSQNLLVHCAACHLIRLGGRCPARQPVF